MTMGLLVLSAACVLAAWLGLAESHDGPGAGKKQVFVVDDHPIMREGIRMLVNQEPDLAVCGEADTAADAIQGVQRLHPDIAVVDMSMKESSGLGLIKDLRIRYPWLPVLALSMREECFYAERVLRAGAKGYITKDDGTRDLTEGIRKVLAGQVFISEKMAAVMIRTLVGGAQASAVPSVHHLTDRELEVFELIGRGMSTRAIAKKLHLSVKTIGSHREHVKEKLKLSDATDLLKHAIQWVQQPLEADGDGWPPGKDGSWAASNLQRTAK